MLYEVEQKHRLENLADFEQKLQQREIPLGPVQHQIDSYFNHPSREFAQTDEAFRIRQVGELNFVTYKGPRVDRVTKTRQELEMPLTPGTAAAADFTRLLVALGFTPAGTVCKTRRAFSIPRAGHAVVGCIDEILDVGIFVELELTVDQGELDNARQIIASLADELELGSGERRSYLEIFLNG